MVIRSRKPDSLESRIHPQRERIPLLGANYYINDPFYIIYILVKVNKKKNTQYMYTQNNPSLNPSIR